LSAGGDLLAGSKNYSISWAQATIDVTSRDDAFQGAYLAGRRDWTIDIDALYVYTDVAKKVLLSNANAGLAGATPSTVITVIITTAAAVTYTGTANVTSFALAMPAEDAVTYTCSLQGTGALTMSAS
jgi:predicted secreted protein